MTPAELLPQVYDELRRLAAAKMRNETTGHTLDATALVHEVWLKLKIDQSFATKADFFRAASEAMQRILVDHARARLSRKRGDGRKRVPFDEFVKGTVDDPELVIDVHDAIEKLAAEDFESAELARLRIYAGMSMEDAAKVLGKSRATIFRDWSYARAWLTTALQSTAALN